MSAELVCNSDSLIDENKDTVIDNETPDRPRPKSNRKHKVQIKQRYWLVVIGVMFVCAGYNSYLLLQTSIHVEGGLGKFYLVF